MADVTAKLAEALRALCTIAEHSHVAKWFQEWEDAREALAAYEQAQAEPVAWMIRSRTGLIRCCLTEEPDDERRALAEIDGDTITPLFAAPVAQAATPAPAPDAEQLRLAGLTLIGLAEHDQHCEVFDLDDEGKHQACTCGFDGAIAVITQAGKTASQAPKESQQ